MRVYTIEDLENFERDNYGVLICPSGDYTQIKSFRERCSFDRSCVFGAYCSFNEDCSFGRDCSFDKWCLFGKYCSFGESCSFGEWCSFGKCCSFGESCLFSRWCSFDKYCSFGERCNLDNNLKFENITERVDRVVKIDRIGRRKGCTYFFKTRSEIYVRCGCFFGTILEFEAKVKETHKNNEQYRKEYLEAIKYIKAII